MKLFLGSLVATAIVAAPIPACADETVTWTYDHRRCMAFNTAGEGDPSVLLALDGDRLTLRALRPGDMVVSAKETVAMIAKLKACDAEWAAWRKRHPN